MLFTRSFIIIRKLEFIKRLYPFMGRIGGSSTKGQSFAAGNTGNRINRNSPVPALPG